MAEMNYDSMWIATPCSCEHCGWQGMGRDLNEGFDWVLDASPMSCPSCGQLLKTLSTLEFEKGLGHPGGQAATLLQAATFAAGKHRFQRRKDADKSPYINHPLAVSTLLAMEAGVVDTATLCATLLHDTIEDTDTTPEELEKAFGPEIQCLVEEVTDDKALPKGERKKLQLENAAGTSYKARLVKLADKICNLRDLNSAPPANWTTERKREYFDWAKSVVDRIRGTHAALESLFDTAFENRPKDDHAELAEV